VGVWLVERAPNTVKTPFPRNHFLRLYDRLLGRYVLYISHLWCDDQRRGLCILDKCVFGGGASILDGRRTQMEDVFQSRTLSDVRKTQTSLSL
jgi:hypothetical protein